MFFSKSQKREPKPQDNRKFKRYALDVSIHVEGMDVSGNKLEEDTYTLNISANGTRFVSTRDYDRTKPLKMIVHLAFPLGNDAKPGDWELNAHIVRIQNINRTFDGVLIQQLITVKFMGVLGIVYPKIKAWDEIID